MSVTILNADVTVDYFGDNRQKRMRWSGSAGETYTMNQLYSAMATLLDADDTIDDGTAFSAETPVEYTTGKIDSGDTEPWYITFELMEHIKGGALKTNGWTRVTDTNNGIIIVPVVSGGAIVKGDEGFDITGAITGAGTLLEFIDTGSTNDYLVIRPDSSVATNDFTTANQNITCNAHIAVQWGTAASTTGEMIWANLYSIGTIESDTHIYLYQGPIADNADRVRLFSWNDSTQDWYANGHIDVCVALKDITVTTWSIIDNGYVTVFARKPNTLYSSFEVACSTTSGGRNPIPLQTAADLDNTTGTALVTTGSFTVGEIIVGGTSGARGVVTAQVADTTITYYAA